MALFMDVHNDMKGITAEQLKASHQADLDAQKGSDVRFEKAWADPTTGKVFCLASGPDKESVKAVHKKAGHPADEIYETSLVVE